MTRYGSGGAKLGLVREWYTFDEFNRLIALRRRRGHGRRGPGRFAPSSRLRPKVDPITSISHARPRKGPGVVRALSKVSLGTMLGPAPNTVESCAGSIVFVPACRTLGSARYSELRMPSRVFPSRSHRSVASAALIVAAGPTLGPISGAPASVTPVAAAPAEPAAPASAAPIRLIGIARIAPDATDLNADSSPMPMSVAPDAKHAQMPQNRLGAIGSSLVWTGKGNRYIALPDRGPGDGVYSFNCRFETLEIDIDPARAAEPVRMKVVATTMLKDQRGRQLVGIASAFDTSADQGAAAPAGSSGAKPHNLASDLRFDPEGVALHPDGSLFISEEYGTSIQQFAADGTRLRILPIPDKFVVTKPSADPDREIADNTSGRVANRGFEGLAITPDAKKLYALLQSPLIQDHGRKGLFCRLLEFDVASGATRELVYPLDNAKLGTNEIHAINDHQFLVIERDGKGGLDAAVKHINLIDIAGASDVSTLAALPKDKLPEGVRAVSKRVLLDMLDPRWKLAREEMPEKLEAVCLGPTLADGSRTLLVMNDNDFRRDQATTLWVFAIAPGALPELQMPAAGPGPRGGASIGAGTDRK
jgi:hypothetical protein